MSNVTRLVNALKWLIDKRVPVQVEQGKVVSVNATERTCVVDPEDGRARVPGVCLQAVSSASAGLLIIPTVGSYVLYAKVNNSREQNFIVKTTTVEEIQLNGNQFGGMVKVEQLVTELNGLKTQLNDLKSILSAWTPVPNDGGAALKTAAATWAAQQIQPTNSNNLQNTIIKHG